MPQVIFHVPAVLPIVSSLVWCKLDCNELLDVDIDFFMFSYHRGYTYLFVRRQSHAQFRVHESFLCALLMDC